MNLKRFIAAHNVLPANSKIAKAARASAQARACIRGVLKLANKHELLLSIDRVAELEAACVILNRAEADLWKQFDKADK